MIISMTMIAIVLVFAKNRRRGAMLEREKRERNGLYGTYEQGPEYNVANDRNQRYNEDGGNTQAVVTDRNLYYE